MNESNNRAAVSAADLESVTGNAPLHADELPSFAAPVHIHVKSYRKTKHDPDGISIKAVLDGLVAVGILADDSTEQVKKVTFESIKSRDEKTEIEIMEAKC